MIDSSPAQHQIRYVSNFHELVSTSFYGDMNAVCWKRDLAGDFSEIVRKVKQTGSITVIDEEQLRALELSEYGQVARQILLNDLQLLTAHGALPSLNVIKFYDRDNDYPFFPTDVYSFHVDHSPVAVDTFLCTYLGEASEILPNAEATKKILIPQIREELKKIYAGPEEGFQNFLTENFFDLHYDALQGARPVNLGLGHLWRLAVEHDDRSVPACIHRAPVEAAGQERLLLIC